MYKTLSRSSFGTTMEDETEHKTRRSIVTSLPSDYSDVQPKSYDPDFISTISNQMQVPDSIPVMNGDTEFNTRRSAGWGNREEEIRRHEMNVPERILLAGGGAHIGAKPEIRGLNFNDDLPRGSYQEAVGLQTPPRTLTLEEQFPSLEKEESVEGEEGAGNTRVPNGTMAIRETYTPVSTSDSMMVSEEETAQLRNQLVKLSRRLTKIEKQQDVQATREKLLYTAAFGYLMLKFCSWFFRSK
ncbi:uncharacterized protein LOC123543803 [Mercenaria mercenaria]|uniref:uncharacterized protein LOC123543803 n=1 Tax=Mercenaria mercenaria TaxID=6596 RepID=UPI00234EA249|nr:uncharacterized protein LOC123543803 [Mercenaria mercenaria]